MSDIDRFLAEQRERMLMPDEDFDAFLSRRGLTRSTHSSTSFTELITRPRSSGSPRRHVAPDSDSNERARHTDITFLGAGTERAESRISPLEKPGHAAPVAAAPGSRAEEPTPATTAPATENPTEHARSKRKSPEDASPRATKKPRARPTTPDAPPAVHDASRDAPRITGMPGQSPSRGNTAHRMDATALPSPPDDTIRSFAPDLITAPPRSGESSLHPLTLQQRPEEPSGDSAADDVLPGEASNSHFTGAVGLLSPRKPAVSAKAQAGVRTREEMRTARHAPASTGQGGKVLKLPESDGTPARSADSSNVTTPSDRSSRETPVVSTSAARNTTVQSIKNPVAKPQAAAPKGKAKTKGKEKEKEKERFTPVEYAQRLQTKFSAGYFERREQTNPALMYLKGKTIFYFGGDSHYAREQTMRRMDIIVKAGGSLLPTFDAERATHIVTDEGPIGLLRTIGLRKLRDIPQHIPTVKWSWVVSGMPPTLGTTPLPGFAGNAAGAGKGKAVQLEREGPRRLGYEVLHAAFSARVDAGPQHWASPKARKSRRVDAQAAYPSSGGEGSGEASAISDFTQENARAPDIVPGARYGLPSAHLPPPRPLDLADARPRPSAEPRPAPATAASRHDAPDAPLDGAAANDPLAPFYAQAWAEHKAELSYVGESSDGSDDESDIDVRRIRAEPRVAQAQKRGFLCDVVGGRAPSVCPNQDVIDKLKELQGYHRVKGSKEDGWRVYSYDKVCSALQSYPTRIKSYEEARAIRGVGGKTALKIMEILNTGDLKRIQYEHTKDVPVIKLFSEIYNVGLFTARQWYNAGCRTLDDLKAGKGGVKLSSAQKIGLRFHADLITQMPRSEATEIFNLIKPIALAIDSQLFIEIMGSYRRGAPNCGDIDILITRKPDDGRTHRGVLRQLLAELHRKGIITEDLSVPDDYDSLELVYHGLCRMQPGSLRRRIDFLTVPYESRGAALLYYTGDHIFNRSMRLKAHKMGYSLNQRGLYGGVVRNPSDRREKLNEGTIIASETEREIFTILGIPWQEPHERVRG